MLIKIKVDFLKICACQNLNNNENIFSCVASFSLSQCEAIQFVEYCLKLRALQFSELNFSMPANDCCGLQMNPLSVRPFKSALFLTYSITI